LVILIAAAIAAVAGGILAAPAAAQGSNANATAPPASWPEQWVGLYDGQDREGKIAPPGFRVELPTEPETLELVYSLAQPWARMRHDATNFELEDAGQICRPTGPVRVSQVGGFEMLPSPDKITIVAMGGGGLLTGGIRRIYMNRPHLKNLPLTYLGDWIGHWEGETLVLDGVGFNEKTWLTRDRARHSEALHVVERWRLVANNEWIEKTITVDDRFALREPYTVKRYFKKRPDSTYVPEDLCQDTPESRRAWVKLYKRALTDWDEERKNAGSE
jgi:hypothetical protein